MGLIGCYEAFHRASAQLKIELCSLVHTLHFLSSDLVFATRIKSEILKLEISKFVDNEKERRDGRSWYSIIERKTAWRLRSLGSLSWQRKERAPRRMKTHGILDNQPAKTGLISRMTNHLMRVPERNHGQGWPSGHGLWRSRFCTRGRWRDRVKHTPLPSPQTQFGGKLRIAWGQSWGRHSWWTSFRRHHQTDMQTPPATVLRSLRKTRNGTLAERRVNSNRTTTPL